MKTWPFSPRHVVLIPLSAVMLLPLVWMLVTSIETLPESRHFPPTLVPSGIHWQNYPDALDAAPFGRFFANSLIVTLAAVAGNLLLCSLAGYAFAFLRFPFKRTLFVVFLATLMVPFEITIVTNLQTINTLGWYDTFAALAVPFLATGFGAFLLRQTFLQLPKDLQDAAKLDGYGHLRFLTRVAVPLARPTIAALAVFSFLSAWNQYLWPLLVTKDDRLRTVQIGLKQLRATNIDQVNITFAGLRSRWMMPTRCAASSAPAI